MKSVQSRKRKNALKRYELNALLERRDYIADAVAKSEAVMSMAAEHKTGWDQK